VTAVEPAVEKEGREEGRTVGAVEREGRVAAVV
jgi:hypothetical protein